MSTERETADGRWLPSEPLPEPFVGSEPIPEPQSLRADQQLANQILTVDELHAADRIARLQLDAATDLGEAIGKCDRERCVRALRRLVAVGQMAKSLADGIDR